MKNNRMMPALKPIFGADFWKGGQPGYALLSYLSNPDDWAAIVATVSSELAGAAVPSKHIRVLDVGAGIGQTSSQIARRLLATDNIVSDWTLVEPDPTARSFCGVMVSTQPHGYGTARLAPDMSTLHSGGYDAALFVHSTYYLDDLVGDLERAAELTNGGPIIAVAMSEASPFLLGGAIGNHRNLAEDVERSLGDLKWGYERRDLTSRISIPPGLWDSEKVVADWAAFVQDSQLGQVELQRLLRLHLVDGVNLRDAVITIYPRSK